MATTLNQWEVGPFNEGLNISMLASEIDDNQASVLQDFLCDKPGQIYTRGPVRNVVQNNASLNGSTQVIKGFFSTNSPDGVTHLGTVTQDSGATTLNFTTLSDTGNAIGISVPIDTSFPLTSDCVVDAKPALGGGLWVGTQELNATPATLGRQSLFHWRGGTKANNSTGTISCTVNSPTVTGTSTSWLTTVSPGMFLFAGSGNTLVGVVASVQTNTSLTLEFAANVVLTGALIGPSFSSIRSFIMEVSKGRIKTQTSNAGVIGSGTKFLSTPFDTGHVFPIYRARDNTWVGSFASASGDESMTMNANAVVAMDNELYVSRPLGFSLLNDFMVNPNSGAQSTRPGIFNAVYAGVQWFARNDGPTTVGTGDMHSRVWFSDYRNQNSLDMLAQDGDFFQVTSTGGKNTPILGIAATQSALLIFKETETFAITGDSPDTYSLDKIWDDGCISPSSIQLYRGAVIWAGRNGIYIFDGKSVDNLVGASIGPQWPNYFTAFDPRTQKLTGAIFRDHYFLSINTLTGQLTGGLPWGIFTKNGTQAGQMGCFVVYIPTRALSTFSNPIISGSARVGATTFFTTNKTYVCDFTGLFSIVNGVKDFPDIAGAPFFPDPLFEGKWYSMKDPLRKKNFRQIMATMSKLNQNVTVEVAQGADTDSASTWSVVTSPFLSVGGIAFTARLKFLKRDRFIRIKMYQPMPSGPGEFSIRKFSIAYKWLKIGRL